MRGPTCLAILILALVARATADPAQEPVPKVVLEPVEVGNPAKAFRMVMKRVVRTKRAELDACLEEHPDAKGSLLVAFDVQVDGTLAAIRAVDPGGLAPDLVACVIHAMGTWRLPAPDGGGVMHARYPLELPLPGRRIARARPVMGKPNIQGALSAAQIQEGIKAHLGDIRACWQAELRPCPTLHAKLVVRFEIGPGGDVTDARTLQNTSAYQNLETCVLARIRSWRFPKPKDGAVVTVTYPFLFAMQ